MNNSEILKDYYKTRGVNKKAFSLLCGVNGETLRQIEAYNYLPTEDVVNKINTELKKQNYDKYIS